MTRRLTIVCCAATATARSGGFAGVDEGIDAAARARAATGAARGPAVAASGRAAQETAAAMGLDAVVETAIDDMGWGAWAGRSFAEIHGADPEALAAWLADPAAGTPGGETFVAVTARAGRWLDATAGRTIAVTYPMTIRAVLAAAIGVPADVAFRIDIAPLSRVELSCGRGWRLQALVPA